MAIVTSGATDRGAKFRFHDNAYVHNTPEQNEALRLDACRAADNILLQSAKENQGGNRYAETCRDDH